VTTAIFTVVDSVLPRPPQGSIASWWRCTVRRLVPGLPPITRLPRAGRSFEGLPRRKPGEGHGRRPPERVSGLQVSANLLDVLGFPALHGDLRRREDQPGAIASLFSVTVCGSGAGADPIVGRDIRSTASRITSSASCRPRSGSRRSGRPAGTMGAVDAERQAHRSHRTIASAVRPIEDGVSVAQAHQEMTAIAACLEHEYPESNTGISIAVRPLLDKVVSGVRATCLP
jgi:hypothetical protein